MADQTNAEVSDERVREALRWISEIATANFEQDDKLRSQGARTLKRIADKADDALDDLNRRSVTSQASEGAELTEALTLGWWNSKDLKLTITETGEVMTNDREALRAIFDALPEVPHGGIKGFDVVPAAPVSKRVERLEAALTEARAELKAAFYEGRASYHRVGGGNGEFAWEHSDTKSKTALGGRS